MIVHYTYEERGEKKLVLTCVTVPFNLRSGIVGINQISHTYMPHMTVEANHFLL